MVLCRYLLWTNKPTAFYDKRTRQVVGHLGRFVFVLFGWLHWSVCISWLIIVLCLASLSRFLWKVSFSIRSKIS